jgi:site-specific DNA recombinase
MSAAKLRVIAYPRVSTDEQSEEGVSLQAQVAKMRAYAELYGIEIVDVVEDAGFSGKTLDRPGLQSILARLKRKEIDGILVAKLDRLSRNVADWNYLITHYFGEKPGKQLLSVADQIDTRTATGRMVLNMMMTIYQWERETIAERTRDALRYKKSVGQKTGGAIPYGSMLGPDKPGPKGAPIKTLVPCPAEQEVLALMKTLRAGGMTLVGIASELTARGIERREGGTWDHGYISRLLKKTA